MELTVIGLTISWTNILAWTVFGSIVGSCAYFFRDSSVRGSLFTSMVLGTFGAISGGALATFVYGIGMRGLDITSLAIAIVASLGFLTLYQLTEVKTNSKIHS